MTATFRQWIRRRAAVHAALAAAVVTAMTGCSVGTDSRDDVAAGPASRPVTSSVAPGLRLLITFGDSAIAATLTDTPASRQFAAMLPLTVQLKDVWGQAKSGRLPHVLTAGGGTPVHDPTPGEIYFWPRSEVIAIYYADLGQAVPGPGLIRLGVVDAGLESLANAGKRVTVRFDLAAGTSS